MALLDRPDPGQRRARRLRRLVAGATAVAAALALGGCVTTSTWEPPQAGSSGLPGPSTPVGPSTIPSTLSGPSTGPTQSLEDACVQSTVAKLSLRQLVGQVLLVGVPIGDPSAIDDTLTEYQFGGVFLAGRYHDSASKLRSEISALQSTAKAPTGVHLFISLDQEGGDVQTLQGSDFPPIPTAVNQGKLTKSALYSQTASWATLLADVGVNLDLAPVADTVPADLGTGNPPIGFYHRQYGSDPVAVASDITTVVSAIQSTGVVTTLKHFPGLGRVLENTDTAAHAVDDVATTDDPYLGPFVAGIKASTGAVMVSSATYPKLDPGSIATFSEPIVTGLLRDKLGFTGLIVSDSLAGAAAVASVPVGQRAVKFIQAGGDLALVTTYTKAAAMFDGLLAAAQASPSFTAKVTAAATYVMHAKYVAGLLSCSPARG